MKKLGPIEAAMLVVVSSCATVPKDAPVAFHEAHALLETLDDKDVDDYLPHTVEHANDTFNSALSLLKESKKAGNAGQMDTAIQRAIASRKTADGALKIYDRIKSWDASESNFQDALALLEKEHAPMISHVVGSGVTSPYAKLKDSEFKSSVAFFKTNHASGPTFYAEEFNALTKILLMDEKFGVLLSGFADMRGPSHYNKDLAMRRAKAVAKALELRGVKPNQITYRSLGESMALAGNSHDAAKLQLDRRVQASLIIQ